MLSRFSISTLLKCVVAIFGAIVVAMLAQSARESWNRLQTATRISEVANISGYMFTAMNSLRVDRSSSLRGLLMDKTPAKLDPLMVAMRASDMPALNGLVAALQSATFPGHDAAAADFAAKINRLAELQKETEPVFLKPKAERPPNMAQDYGKAATAVMDALNSWGAKMIDMISLQDPYVDQLLEIKELAWIVRNMGGEASVVISNALAGQPLPADALTTYTANVARLDLAWSALNDIAARMPMPPSFAAAVDKVKKDYFGGGFVEERARVLKALIAGEATGYNADTWAPQSVAKLDSLLGVATTTLEIAKDHAAEQALLARHDLMVQLGLLVAFLVFACGMMLFVSRHVTGPLGAIQGAMLKLAGGDFEVVLPGLERKDEIGAVANAVERFKVLAVDKARGEADAAMARQKADADRQAEAARTEAEAQAKVAAERAKASEEQAYAFHALGDALGHLADGDFTIRLDDDIPEEYAQVRDDFNRAIERLHETIQAVAASTREVANAAGEISTATTDLSQRVEEQAASLAETSASMEEISATVQTNAKNAQQANELTSSTQGAADHGGQVVAEAVTAMSRIEESSRQISDIITVIDEIARQTNLLALNAAVEAARAGDAGRGFAVVASEVRSLAQRSSEAAKNITDLIAKSSNRVKEGVGLVNRAGTSLGEIVASIKQVAGIVANIATASAEQSTGLEQISKALAQMDDVTQQNSALVEENTATAKTLQQQSQDMQTRIASFKLDRGPTARKRRNAA